MEQEQQSQKISTRLEMSSSESDEDTTGRHRYPLHIDNVICNDCVQILYIVSTLGYCIFSALNSINVLELMWNKTISHQEQEENYKDRHE